MRNTSQIELTAVLPTVASQDTQTSPESTTAILTEVTTCSAAALPSGNVFLPVVLKAGTPSNLSDNISRPTPLSNLTVSTALLNTGESFRPTGVLTDTIDPEKAAILRGRVCDREHNPIVNVEITILGHPEYNPVYTDADGIFEMVVNGGGILTVIYEKNGYLSVQRKVDAPWQNYALLPEVVLIARDNQVTTIDLTASDPIQVAQGSVVSDTDGLRQATLFIPQGTEASIFNTDGTTETVTTLNLRLTEYTVGESGQAAMPADLPANSGYTYAVEISADEATVRIGGTDVLLSQPATFYLENFLDFFVGVPVPMGYYDNDRGVWVASDSGQVIEIVSLTSGMADLDTDGDGVADNDPALGITAAERTELASRYKVGKSLWRIMINHLSTYDANWNVRCFGNTCNPPRMQYPPKQQKPLDKSDKRCASVIGCQAQSLGEVIDLSGTPFRLHYQSNRVPGAGYWMEIPLTDENFPPDNLIVVHLQVYVAGRYFTTSWQAVTVPSSVFFHWDGRDADGNLVNGSQLVTVRVGYGYELEYVRTDRFGYSGDSTYVIAVDFARGEFGLWQEWEFPLGVEQNRPEHLGGWELDIHHTYDPVAGVVHLGYGEQRSAEALNVDFLMQTVAGNGTGGALIDDIPATSAALGWVTAVETGPDGGFFVAANNNRIRQIDAEGIIHTMVGMNQSCGFTPDTCGDGGSAAQARLRGVGGLDLGPDGSLYIADTSAQRIRHINPDGIITTIAGNGQDCPSPYNACFGGDGGLATQARFAFPRDVAVSPDGSVYIADTENRRIRRVDTNGIISTAAGGGSAPIGASGVPATDVALWEVIGIEFAPDGSFYFTEVTRIRRVGPDGIITTVAGTGQAGYTGDGGQATQARIRNLTGLAIAPDGGFFFMQGATDAVIRHVSPDGIITTVAGTPNSAGFSGDGLPALRARINPTGGGFLGSPVALAPDGSLYIADISNMRTRRIHTIVPRTMGSGLLIPSEDGAEVYVFDFAGQHKRTLHALTGAVLYEFGYNANNRLVTVTDGDDNVTTINRDANGSPTGITGPYGQTTTFTRDANGYLATVANPAGESYQMGYTAEGLLTSFTNPRNYTTSFTYDSLGRLVREDDAMGGWVSLDRTDIGQSYEVTLNTALSRTTTYEVAYDNVDNQTRTNTLPSGLQTVATKGINGSQSSQSPDGTTTSTLFNPDPRWGMLAPVPGNATIHTPDGLTASLAVVRTAVLTDTINPFSLETLNETVTINGRSFTSLYTAANQTFLDTTHEGRQFTLTIDEQGRPVLDQIAGLLPTSYSYDNRGRLSSATQGSGLDARTVTFTYNSHGYLATATDPLNRTVSFLYDLAGRVRQQTLPDGRVIGYGYNANGNLTSITPPGRPPHTFAYNEVNLLTAYTPPDVLPGTDQTLYNYNLERQLTQIARPDGQTIDYGYDSAGRLNDVTIGRGTVHYGYDVTTGNLISVTAPGGSGLAYSYDGFLLTGESWSGLVAGTTGYTYDNNFRLTASTVNGGNSISYQYDDDDLLTQAGALTLNYQAQNGLLTGTSLGSVADSWAYNGFAEPVTYTAAYNANTLYQVVYSRDDLGRITQKTETISGTTSTYGYSYDLAGRLTGVTQNGLPIATYTYDSNGNRLTFTGPGGTVTGSYDNQDRLLQYGTNTYTYTANGERLTKSNSGQPTSYTYDAFGNLMVVTLPDGTQITYLVDGQNRRIGKQVNSTLVQGFLYNGQLRPVAELDGAGNIVSRFIYATDINIPDYMIKDGVTYRIVTDQLGSPRLMVNAATGAIVQRIDYDEFGRVLNDTNPGFQPFGFAGGLYDRDTKLVRFGARDYDAETGRWTTKDPIGMSGGMNAYVYVRNNPANHKDATGLLVGPYPPPVVTGVGIGTSAAAVGIAFGVGYAIGTGINYLLEDSIQAALTRFLPEPDGPDSPGQWTLELHNIKVLAYKKYKERCGSPAPSGLNKCEAAKWRAARALDCALMRAEWDRRFYPGRHATAVSETYNAEANALLDVAKNCPPPSGCN